MRSNQFLFPAAAIGLIACDQPLRPEVEAPQISAAIGPATTLFTRRDR